MCVILHQLFKCGCKEVKGADPCPMMDSALDLVDTQGVPADDIRIQKLEKQCMDKSATRYEIQTGICDLCNRSIAAVGIETWLAAKRMRDIDEENNFFAEIERQDAAVTPVGRKTFVDDDYVYDDEDDDGMHDGASPASVRTTRPNEHRNEKSSMRFLRDDVASRFLNPGTQAGGPSTYKNNRNARGFQHKHDATNPVDLDFALAAVLASRKTLDDYYDAEDMCDTNDDNGISGTASQTDGRISRSAAPSPSHGQYSNDAEWSLACKGKGKGI